MVDTLKSKTVIDTPTIRKPTMVGITTVSDIFVDGTITTDSIIVLNINVADNLYSDSINTTATKTTRIHIDTIKTATKTNKLIGDTIVNKLITSDTVNQISSKTRRLRGDTIISCDTAYIKNLKWDRVHNTSASYFFADSSNQIYTSSISVYSIYLSGTIIADSANSSTGILTTRMRSDSIISTAANIKRLKSDTITTCDTAEFGAAKIIRLSGDTVRNNLLTADSIYARKIKFGVTYDTTFSMRMIGFVDTPYVGVRARVVGQTAQLNFGGNTGTSNRNFIKIDQLPPRLAPYCYGATNFSVPINAVCNNDVYSNTYRINAASGSSYFYLYADTASTINSFTTSGTKGMRAFTLIYNITGEY
jgi:hypothetical protein